MVPDAAHGPDGRRFEIRRRIESGGFGDVYLATMYSSRDVSCEVALKVLRRGLDPQSAAVRTLGDEGRLLSLLRHPNLLHVHDVVVLDGRATLVLEYVAGDDLERCLQRGPLPMRAAVEVAGQVADALDAAWSQPDRTGAPLHLVHRDVKPANVRLGRFGEVKLLDFGLSRVATSDEATGIDGSASYLAPERFDPTAPDLPSADVYALAATLYASVVGEELWGDLTVERQFLAAQSAAGHDAHVTRRLEALPEPALLPLLRRALSYGADERPTAAGFRTACEDLAETLPGPGLRAWAKDQQWSEGAPTPRRSAFGALAAMFSRRR